MPTRHTPYRQPTPIEVLKLLHRRNGCGQCGYPTCLAFATALCREEASPDACRPLLEEADGAERLEQLRMLVGA